MASSKVTCNKYSWFWQNIKLGSLVSLSGFISVAEALTVRASLLEFLFHCWFDRWANFARYEMSDDCASSIRFKGSNGGKKLEKNSPLEK